MGKNRPQLKFVQSNLRSSLFFRFMRSFFDFLRWNNNNNNTAGCSSNSTTTPKTQNSSTFAATTSRESSVDSCSEAATEVTLNTEMHPNGEIKEFIGNVLDINDQFITLTTNQMDEQYKIKRENVKFDVELDGYYKCKGQKGNGEFFSVETIKKLERGCPEVKEQFFSNSPPNAAILNFPSGFENFFNQFGENGPKMEEEEGETKQDETLKEANQNCEAVEFANNVDLAAALEATFVGSFASGSFETTPKAALSEDNAHSRPISPDHCPVSAIVLSLGSCRPNDGQKVLMFSPDRPHLSFFPFPRQSLQEPVKNGQWYEIQIEREMEEGELSDQFKPIADAQSTPPMPSRIRNGTVQLYAEANVSRCAPEGVTNGFLRCFSPKMPPIIDSECLLNHLDGIEFCQQPPIRNAPMAMEKIGIWCAPRRRPFGGYAWKVVGLEVKYRKKKKTIGSMEMTKKMDGGGGAMRGRKATKIDRNGFAADGKENKKDDGNRATPTFRQSDEGMICASTATELIVYAPCGKTIAYMDKRKTNVPLLGFWIQFKTREEDGRQIVTTFQVIPHRMDTMLVPNGVTLNCAIVVPRALESSLLPHCKELGIDLTDPHNQIKQTHRGRTIPCQIGCRMEGSENELCWEILYVKDE